MNPTWVGSPNFTSGRNGTVVDHIVIHWMDGNLAGADAVFQDRSRDTSAHYGVEDGVIHQYVQESDTAYHAGNWAMNLRSIGIEHSAQPGRDASDSTYQTSARLISDIVSRNPHISLDRIHILRHGEVIATECCGTVDPNKLIALAQGGSMDEALKDALGYKNKFLNEVGAIPLEGAKVITTQAYDDFVEWKSKGEKLQALAGVDLAQLVDLLKQVEGKLL